MKAAYYLNPEKLRLAAYRAKLTQSEIGRQMCLSRSSVAQMWNEHKAVDAARAEALAKVLGVTVADIEL